MATVSQKDIGGRPRQKTPCAWGRRVEAMARARGLSRTELAKRVGITYVSLWGFLMGNSRPSLQTACKLADALRVPLDKLR
jgi:transcriptional regulator with XRE-family HTH domain